MTINKESECVNLSNCRCIECVTADIAAHLKAYPAGKQIAYTLLTVSTSEQDGTGYDVFFGTNFGIDNSIELMETFIEKQRK